MEFPVSRLYYTDHVYINKRGNLEIDGNEIPLINPLPSIYRDTYYKTDNDRPIPCLFKGNKIYLNHDFCDYNYLNSLEAM